MKVIFKKDCPWCFSQTKRLARPVKFRKGAVENIEDVEAQSMIKTGYAEEYVETPGKKKAPVKVKKTEDDQERYDLYKSSFSLDSLIVLCVNNGVYLDPALQRTEVIVINTILKFEKINGQIMWSKE